MSATYRYVLAATLLLAWSSAAPPALAQRPLPNQAADWQPAAHEQLAEEHHARSLLEMAGGLALGSVLYWLMMNRNVADWDNPTPEERFNGSAWRLDNNSLGVNFIAHPFMGGGAYSAARANHHDPLTSLGYSFLTSFLWEFVLEFKEKVSVNDMIVTPGTGFPLGEFFYKLGLYLDTARPSTGASIAQWSLGTGVALDRALDGRGAPAVRRRDNLGLGSAMWHEFELDSGLDVVRSPGSASFVRHGVGARGKLVSLPGYLRAGRFGRFFSRGEISEFAISAEASRHGLGMAISADTLVLGYHAQDMAAGARSAHGYAATFGVSVAYAYLKSKANEVSSFREAAAQPDPSWSYHVPKTAEQFAAFHLPGPAFDWTVSSPELALSFTARAHPDFVGLGAPAFYDWAGAHREDKSKHILHRQGYFYGWGASGALGGRLRAGPLRLSGDVFYGRYRSQDGLDRHVERLTDDVPARGNVLFYNASLGVKPPLLPLVVAADFGVRRYNSRVGSFERQGHILHRGFRLSTTF